jgi:hypothetical protein
MERTHRDRSDEGVMALTRAIVETELVRRLGGYLTAAGLAITTAGSNADLSSPIAYALRASGYSLATAGTPADADLDDVTAADEDKVYDLAELRALENIYRHYTKVDSKAGAVEAKLDQLRAGIRIAIADKKAQIADDYGIGGGYAFSVALTRADGYTDLDEEE